jgi:large subunit ribosomal protein L4
LKVEEQRLLLTEAIVLEEGKTREMAQVLRCFADKLNGTGKVLIVVAESSENVQRASRNIPDVRVVLADNVSAFHLFHHDTILVEQKAATIILGRIMNA